MVALAARPQSVSAAPEMQALDSIRENGSKLVEMTAEGELRLRLRVPGLKIVSEAFYHRQWQRFKVHHRPLQSKTKATAPKAEKVGRRMMKAAATAGKGFSITIVRFEWRADQGRPRCRLQKMRGARGCASDNRRQGAGDAKRSLTHPCSIACV
jgi:hypothetical protein